MLTDDDPFVGAAWIKIGDIKEEGQVYYTRLPLVNADAEAEHHENSYAKASAKGFVPRKGNMTGFLHIKAVKSRLLCAEEQDVELFDDESVVFKLEVECVAVSHLTLLKSMEFGSREFWIGVLCFIVYLLFYAMVMFVAELDTSTGINEYKESIWFALITVTTLGYGDITTQTPYSKVLNAFFIAVNTIIIGWAISLLLSYIVDRGEKGLNTHMRNLEKGVRDVHGDQLQPVEKGRQRGGSAVALHQHQSVGAQKSARDEEKRRKSMPAMHLSSKVRTLQQASLASVASAVQEVEAETAKTQHVQLQELSKLDSERVAQFRTKMFLNIFLLVAVLLFGFIFLGCLELLEGPNFLTNLPHYDYDCDSNYNAEYCALRQDAGSVFVDSVYYCVVSMSTVGYGDIYPQTGAVARLCGAVFILFGTLMLVRIIDVVTNFLAFRRSSAKKAQQLRKLLQSHERFFEFDVNGDGLVSRYEFLRGMLLELDLTDAEKIDEIMAIFALTDANGDGVVTIDELREKVKADRLALKWGAHASKEIQKEWDAIERKKQRLTQREFRVQEREMAVQQKEMDLNERERRIEQREIEAEHVVMAVQEESEQTAAVGQQ